MNSTKLSVFCSKVLEVCWLLAVIVTPLFFNIYSSRVFEPDKLTTLRTLALIMAAVWLVKLIEEVASGKRDLGFTWRTPLVLPALFTVIVYLLSTALSVTARVSLFGSYQRLQGTYTTLSYIVVFFVVLQELRTRDQLDRLMTVIILNSLPIALYGFLQHNKLDPLPWGGDVTRRIASNMGNAIFVAAYMIMAALPTLARVLESFRAILADEETGVADVLRAAAYIFAFLVQIIAIWYSLSRGPQMGLLAGLGIWAFLGLLALQQAARRERPLQPHDLLKDVGQGLAFALGSLVAAGAAAAIGFFVARAIATPESDTSQWVAAGGAVLTLLGLWLAFIVNRKGWRWLWISALVIAVLFSTGFLLINLSEPIREWSTQQPWLGRLDDVLQPEGGTGMVRNLIWRGALDLITPHEPIEYPPTSAYPEGRPDPFNALRVLVGYGPESMYVAYNRFYPPLLGHYESRTASPDRSHNETMDALVITGLLGFAAYVWIFGAVFYFGLRWLGMLPDGWRRTLFFILLAAGAIAAAVAVIPALGPHFFCLGIPVGMVAGLFLYLVVYAFSAYREPEIAPQAHPHAILLIGIMAAVVAHLIEINFGISIASTRTTFWAFAGVFVVTGLNWVREYSAQPETQNTTNEKRGRGRRRKRRKVTASSPQSFTLPAWLVQTLTAAIVGGFILGTLTFDFIGTNPDHLEDPLKIMWQALTVLPAQQNRTSYGLVMVFGLTWLISAVVSVAQMVKEGVFHERENDWLLAGALYLLVSLAVGFGFALVLAGRQVALLRVPIQNLDDLITLSDRVAGTLTTYYWFIVFALIIGGVTLYLGVRRQPRLPAHPWGVLALIVLVILIGAVAVPTNLHPIQADIIFKQGDPYERAGQWLGAIELYKHAIELTPKEDFYYLYLGRAYLEYAKTMQDLAVRDNVMQLTEQTLLNAREINPLNTDHSANLARMYRTWAEMTPSAEAEKRQTLFQESDENYAIATSLSPNHAILWNEWGRLHLYLGDFERTQELVSHSLEIDPDYDQTWLLQADLYAAQDQLDEAVEAYEQAVEIYPRSVDVWLRLGDIHMNQNQLEEAAQAYEKALELKPKQAQVLRILGSVYAQLGRLDDAIATLHQALDLNPEASDAWDTNRVLAIVYAQSGQNDQALYYAQNALELAPEDQRPNLEALVAQLQQSGGGEQP